jgi:hypothetical protein
MARSGGNPDFATKYAFKPIYDWGEPCDQLVAIRFPASLKAAIKAGLVDDWQEICRQAVADAIKENSKPPQQS